MPALPTAPPHSPARVRRARPPWQRCWACAGRVWPDEAVCAACGAAPRRRVGASARRAAVRAALRAYRRAGYRVLALGPCWATLAPPRRGPLAWLGRLVGARPRPLYLAVDACGWLRDSEGRCTPPRRARRRLASRWATHRRGLCCARPATTPPIPAAPHSDPTDAPDLADVRSGDHGAAPPLPRSG